MDAGVLRLIGEIAGDAIKILGPAILVYLGTRHAAGRQMEAKLREMEQVHEFAARERMFRHYAEKQEVLRRNSEQVMSELGSILGHVTGSVEEETVLQGASAEALPDVVSDIVDLHLRLCPRDVQDALREMRLLALGDTDDYRELTASVDRLSRLAPTTDVQQLKTNIFALVEVYALLQRSSNMILDRNTEAMLGLYIKEASAGSSSHLESV